MNQHHIRKNAHVPPNERVPVFTVKRGRYGKINRYAMDVEILGPSRLVYEPDTPLKCGAKAWIVTDSEVRLDGKPFDEAPDYWEATKPSP